MKPGARPGAGAARDNDIAAIEQAIAGAAPRLHGIASRTEAAIIAAEVLRLNDSVRAGAKGRLRSGDQPQDFAALLLATADSTNVDPTP